MKISCAKVAKNVSDARTQIVSTPFGKKSVQIKIVG
jgi:hypothetical protein